MLDGREEGVERLVGGVVVLFEMVVVRVEVLGVMVGILKLVGE